MLAEDAAHASELPASREEEGTAFNVRKHRSGRRPRARVSAGAPALGVGGPAGRGSCGAAPRAVCEPRFCRPPTPVFATSTPQACGT